MLYRPAPLMGGGGGGVWQGREMGGGSGYEHGSNLLPAQLLCIKPCGMLVTKDSNLKKSLPQIHFFYICNNSLWYSTLKGAMYIPIMISAKIGRPHTPRGLILLKVLLLLTCTLKCKMFPPLFTTGQLEGKGQTSPIALCPAQPFFIRGTLELFGPRLHTYPQLILVNKNS